MYKHARKYEVGDKVTKRPSGISDGLTVHAKRIGNRGQVAGTVTSTQMTTNSAGSKIQYVYVQWEDRKSPSRHLASRIHLK